MAMTKTDARILRQKHSKLVAQLKLELFTMEGAGTTVLSAANLTKLKVRKNRILNAIDLIDSYLPHESKNVA